MGAAFSPQDRNLSCTCPAQIVHMVISQEGAHNTQVTARGWAELGLRAKSIWGDRHAADFGRGREGLHAITSHRAEVTKWWTRPLLRGVGTILRMGESGERYHCTIQVLGSLFMVPFYQVHLYMLITIVTGIYCSSYRMGTINIPLLQKRKLSYVEVK